MPPLAAAWHGGSRRIRALKSTHCACNAGNAATWLRTAGASCESGAGLDRDAFLALRRGKHGTEASHHHVYVIKQGRPRQAPPPAEEQRLRIPRATAPEASAARIAPGIAPSGARAARACEAGGGLERLGRRQLSSRRRRSLAPLGARNAHRSSCARHDRARESAPSGGMRHPRQRIAHGREMRAHVAYESQQMRDVPFLAVAGRPRVGDATGDTAGSGAARGSGEAAGGARLAGCAFARAEANSVALAFAPSLGVVAASAAAAPKENESLAAAPRPRGDAGAGAAPRFLAGGAARPPAERRLGALSSRKASVAKAASAAEHSARPGSCGGAGKRVSTRATN